MDWRSISSFAATARTGRGASVKLISACSICTDSESKFSIGVAIPIAAFGTMAQQDDIESRPHSPIICSQQACSSGVIDALGIAQRIVGVSRITTRREATKKCVHRVRDEKAGVPCSFAVIRMSVILHRIWKYVEKAASLSGHVGSCL
jgi:hypothetical protein